MISPWLAEPEYLSLPLTQETLTRHKPMVAQYLSTSYDRFFSSYQTLILSPNYVTKRQSLKLLGEILLDRANFNVMTRYIASKENLQVVMNTLRDKSKNIQFEAFHVFKVGFVHLGVACDCRSWLDLRLQRREQCQSRQS